jgi:aryl carrier-like protein
VPDVFVVLDALPLTSSGKIDRSALPAPDRSLPGDEGPAPPSTAEERLLASIWSEVLGVGPVGTHDNLFDLGGNSLLVFQITARAARAGYPITPRQLFEHPTVAELARAAGPLLRDSADASRRKVAHG